MPKKQYIYRPSAKTPQAVVDFLDEQDPSESFPHLFDRLIEELIAARNGQSISNIEQAPAPVSDAHEKPASQLQECILESQHHDIDEIYALGENILAQSEHIDSHLYSAMKELRKAMASNSIRAEQQHEEPEHTKQEQNTQKDENNIDEKIDALVSYSLEENIDFSDVPCLFPEAAETEPFREMTETPEEECMNQMLTGIDPMQTALDAIDFGQKLSYSQSETMEEWDESDAELSVMKALLADNSE